MTNLFLSEHDNLGRLLLIRGENFSITGDAQIMLNNSNTPETRAKANARADGGPLTISGL